MSDTPQTLSKNEILGIAELHSANVLDIALSDYILIGYASTTESQESAEITNSLTDPAVNNLDLSHVQHIRISLVFSVSTFKTLNSLLLLRCVWPVSDQFQPATKGIFSYHNRFEVLTCS